MTTRRSFILSAGAGTVALAGVSLGLASCSSKSDEEKYDEITANLWRHSRSLDLDRLSIQRELVRYATLAPSSHNTQCWKFRIEERAISIAPDLSRRCPAVDPDDHHLYVSLGCATENLAQAALANGFMIQVGPDPKIENGFQLSMDPTKAKSADQFLAIPSRQCNRSEFDGKSLSHAELSLLEQAGTGEGVQCLMITDTAAKEQILELVAMGNSAQMEDAAFIAELKTWIRFNSKEAIQKGDGLYSATTGNPALPTWLGNLVFNLIFRTSTENDKNAKNIRSAVGVAIFSSEKADKAQWLEVGRCYQRFALQANTMGIRNSMLNQPVEVAAIRPLFARHLGLGSRRPDLVVRFGRGGEVPRSLRRPVADVVI